MNHPWQQPIRPLEVRVPDSDIWVPVIFIRPAEGVVVGWEVITRAGVKWTHLDTHLRYPQDDK